MKTALIVAALLVAAPVGVHVQAPAPGMARWETVATESFEVGPYILELNDAALKQPGAKLTGTLRQSGGPQPGPVDIFEASFKAGTITFKVKSPDGDRTVTFAGQVNGDTMTLKRRVDVRDGGSPGGAGIFGMGGPPSLTLKRQAGARQGGAPR